MYRVFETEARTSMRHKVTLITPLKNERDSVSQLWQAIQDQTLVPDEWLITDNGSTDGTYEWLVGRQSSGRYTVRVIPMPGQTIAQMMNAAIGQANHEIIACCHGGTEIPNDWLENLVQPLVADESVEVAAGVSKAVGRTRVERWIATPSIARFEGTSERAYLPASRSLAFRRSAWQRVGGFPEWLPRFGEDTLFAIRLRTAGCRFVIVRDAVVGWRPKSTARLALRQWAYYCEADGLMGLPSPQVWRTAGKLCGVALVPIFAGLCFGSRIIALASLGALLVGDFIRVTSTRARYSPPAYIFCCWLLPAAMLAGRVRGMWQRWLGRTRVPARDRDAIRLYYSRKHTRL
jgi:GT2 family glycosyltransferase